MQIINRRTVDLTALEYKANREYECLLSDGHAVDVAAGRIEEQFPGLDPAFYRWLRDESLMPQLVESSEWHAEWHAETWAEVVTAIQDHFAELGFRVDTNSAMGTVTIIHERKALTVMNTTGSHFDAQNRLHLPMFA